jgi:hypothetical protein
MDERDKKETPFTTKKTTPPNASSESKQLDSHVALPAEVKDLGRKARGRREEMRSKRPEIVRLEALPPPEPTARGTKRSSSIFAFASTVAHQRKRPTLASRKHRIASGSAIRSTGKASKKEGDDIVDHWMPEISHLPAISRDNSVSTSQDLRSNVVQLHGLPLQTTPNQIRRFFSGLKPQRIVVLPSNPVTIPAWDSIHSMQPNSRVVGHKNKTVGRYNPHFRVLVKFHSAPTAELGVQRSGEIMTVGTASKNNDQVEANQSVTIAVVPIIKKAATCLMKKLAIEGDSGVPLEDTLQNTEKQLDPAIAKILWTQVITDLNLKVRTSKPKNDLFFPLHKPVKDPRKPEDYRKLAEHRNWLYETIERLQNTSWILTVVIIDLSVLFYTLSKYLQFYALSKVLLLSFSTYFFHFRFTFFVSLLLFSVEKSKGLLFSVEKSKGPLFYLNSLGPKGADGFHSCAPDDFLLAENYSLSTPYRAQCC